MDTSLEGNPETSADYSLRLVDDPLILDSNPIGKEDEDAVPSDSYGYALPAVSQAAPSATSRLGDWAVFQGFIAKTDIRIFGASRVDFAGSECKYIDEGTSFIVKSALLDTEPFGTRPLGNDPEFAKGEMMVAVKLVKPLDSQEKLESVCLEILALTHPPLRDHPNIIGLLGLTWTTERETSLEPALIVELAEYGSLDKYLHSRSLDRAAQAKICVGVAEGLDILHQCAIIHGDVKCENVLVVRGANDSVIPKLADFGFSLVLPKAQLGTKLIGTPRWNAPEISNGNFDRIMQDPSRLRLLDIYSYGLLVWRVLKDGQDPFNDQVVMSHEDVLFLKTFTNEPLVRACRFVHALIDKDPHDRYLPSFEQVFKETLPRDALERCRNLGWIKRALSSERE